MLFWCSEQTGGCEWHRLRGLVDQYNQLFGSRYAWQACLDRQPGDRSAPEVLLASPGEVDMVIEHKSVASTGSSYFHNHAKDHVFFNRFCETARSRGETFSDGAYLLSIGAGSFADKKQSVIAEFADHVAVEVTRTPTKAKSPLGIGTAEPIGWHFRPQMPWERDESAPKKGVGIEVTGESMFPRPGDYKHRRYRALAGYEKEFVRAARGAERSFEDYRGHRKLFAVQFFGEYEDGVGDDDIIAMIEETALPPAIEQVWVANPEFVNENDWEIGWKLVSHHN